MGRKGSETTEEERKIIIRLHNQCKSFAQISNIVGRARSTIKCIIDRFGARKTLKNTPRSGRTHVLSKTDKRFIVRLIKKDPKVSAPTIAVTMEKRGVHVSVGTIRNALRNNSYHGRVMRKKFWVNKTNREKRLQFAKNYLNKDNNFWNKVIFSDESKFNIFGSDGRRTVWRKKKL